MASIGGGSARFSIARVIVVMVAVYLIIMGFAKDTLAGQAFGIHLRDHGVEGIQQLIRIELRIHRRRIGERRTRTRAGHPNHEADHPLWDRWIDQ